MKQYFQYVVWSNIFSMEKIGIQNDMIKLQLSHDKIATVTNSVKKSTKKCKWRGEVVYKRDGK